MPARVTVQFSAGAVTLMPRRAPVGVSEPIRGQTLAVFPTAQRDQAKLLRALAESAGHVVEHAPASIDDGAGGTAPGIAALGMTRAEAMLAGGRLGLGQILFWDGRRASVIACSAAE